MGGLLLLGRGRGLFEVRPRRFPARFEFRRNEAGVGISPLDLPLGKRRLVPQALQLLGMSPREALCRLVLGGDGLLVEA